MILKNKISEWGRLVWRKPNAQNSYNSGNFNYAVIEQLHSDDKVKGIVSRWKNILNGDLSSTAVNHI